jgi:hypothetical protein
MPWWNKLSSLTFPLSNRVIRNDRGIAPSMNITCLFRNFTSST